MITHIRMKNFKSWEDSGEVKLAPLTGFFGTNSSGKSSLLQMLLLLKQTVEHPDLNEVIFFGNDSSLVNLGNFREVIHGHKEDVLLELEFGCKLQQQLTIKTFQLIDKYRQQYGLAPLDLNSFIYNTAISGNASSLSIDRFSYTVGPEEIQKITWKNGNIHYGNRRKGHLSVTKCYGLPKDGYTDLLRPLSSAFENLFNHVYPLGPTRVHPQRRYHWEGTHPKVIDQWGNKSIDALLSAGVRKLKSSTKEDGVLIETRISEWLQKMDIAYSFQLIPTGSLDDKNYEVRIRKTANSAEVTLADMGHGVSDLFPMLVLCYYTPAGSTLILEQPGIHLHPKVQSQLADLLIEVITERNLQILIESHSEHFLNRLQRRIAEEDITPDKTALYFCRNDEGVSEIDRLEMDEFGNIANWPENFFGDEMGDLFAMTEAQRKRQKRAEG